MEGLDYSLEVTTRPFQVVIVHVVHYAVSKATASSEQLVLAHVGQRVQVVASEATACPDQMVLDHDGHHVHEWPRK